MNLATVSIANGTVALALKLIKLNDRRRRGARPRDGR
jgi:hypothetical protein